MSLPVRLPASNKRPASTAGSTVGDLVERRAVARLSGLCIACGFEVELAGVLSKLHARFRTSYSVGLCRQTKTCTRRVSGALSARSNRRRPLLAIRPRKRSTTRHTSCLKRLSTNEFRNGAMAQRAQAIGEERSDNHEARVAPLRRMDAYWRAANYLSVGQI